MNRETFGIEDEMTLKLIFRGKQILERSGEKNVNQLSLRARVAQQTAYKYINRADKIEAVDTKILASLLIDGLGLTKEQVLDLKIGDVFDFNE